MSHRKKCSRGILFHRNKFWFTKSHRHENDHMTATSMVFVMISIPCQQGRCLL